MRSIILVLGRKLRFTMGILLFGSSSLASANDDQFWKNMSYLELARAMTVLGAVPQEAINDLNKFLGTFNFRTGIDGINKLFQRLDDARPADGRISDIPKDYTDYDGKPIRATDQLCAKAIADLLSTPNTKYKPDDPNIVRLGFVMDTLDTIREHYEYERDSVRSQNRTRVEGTSYEDLWIDPSKKDPKDPDKKIPFPPEKLIMNMRDQVQRALGNPRFLGELNLPTYGDTSLVHALSAGAQRPSMFDILSAADPSGTVKKAERLFVDTAKAPYEAIRATLGGVDGVKTVVSTAVDEGVSPKQILVAVEQKGTGKSIGDKLQKQKAAGLAAGSPSVVDTAKSGTITDTDQAATKGMESEFDPVKDSDDKNQ